MPEQLVSLQDVMTWIDESLADYQGRYDVQDLTFVRSMVRVVTPRRDALFDVVNARWPALSDPQARPGMTAELRQWARLNLAPLQSAPRTDSIA
jgi:hypothetical protein